MVDNRRERGFVKCGVDLRRAHKAHKAQPGPTDGLCGPEARCQVKLNPPFRVFKITLRFTPVSKSYPSGNILIF